MLNQSNQCNAESKEAPCTGPAPTGIWSTGRYVGTYTYPPSGSPPLIESRELALHAPAGWTEGLAVAGYTCTPIGATAGTASVDFNRVLPDDDDQVGPPGEGGGGLGAVQATITYYVHTCQ